MVYCSMLQFASSLYNSSDFAVGRQDILQQDRHHLSPGTAMLPTACCSCELGFGSFPFFTELCILQCRQKTVEDKRQCTTCNQQFCPKCLTNRYGEEQEQVCTTSPLHITPPEYHQCLPLYQSQPPHIVGHYCSAL